MKKFVLGIGGYIGSGKTLSGRFLAKLGADFIVADEVVNGLYKNGEEGYRKIVDYFGDDFLDENGEIDRGKISEFVFSDVKKLDILNNLIHPLVGNEVQKMIDASDSRIFLVEAVYFRPKGLGRLVDEILWINCDKDVLAERVLKRDGMTKELFEKILESQVRPDKIDFLIENNGSVEDFEIGLTDLWSNIQEIE